MISKDSDIVFAVSLYQKSQPEELGTALEVILEKVSTVRNTYVY